MQWPTRPLRGWDLEAPGPRGPRKAKFWLAIAKCWLQLELIFMIYLNLKRVRWFGVLFFQNFNEEISYFLTDLLNIDSKCLKMNSYPHCSTMTSLFILLMAKCLGSDGMLCFDLLFIVLSVDSFFNIAVIALITERIWLSVSKSSQVHFLCWTCHCLLTCWHG